jgi:hypothetical protein
MSVLLWQICHVIYLEETVLFKDLGYEYLWDAPFLSKETIVLNCNKESLVSVSEIPGSGTYSYETV